MIHSLRFTSVLDTNVIYPIEVRDILFWFASYDLFTPKWSKHIFDEWTNLMKRKGISDDEIEKRISKANRAFPDALVKNYEPLIASLNLPDPTSMASKYLMEKWHNDLLNLQPAVW